MLRMLIKRGAAAIYYGLIAFGLFLGLSRAPVRAAQEVMTQKRSPDLDKASALLDEGKYTEAEKLLDDVLKANDKDDVAYHLRSFARSYLDNPEGALEDVTRSLELGPQNVGKVRSRAIILLQLKEYEAAAEDFESIAKAYSDSKETLDRETLMLTAVALVCKGGEDGKAVTYMVEAAKVSPSKESALTPFYAVWCIVARVATEPKYKENYSKMLKLLTGEVDFVAKEVAADKAKGKDVAEREYYVLIGRFILGEVAEQDLLAAAKGRSPDTLCEAYFYVSMHYAASGNKAKSEEFLQKTLDLKQFRNMLWMMAEGLHLQGRRS